MDVKTIQSRQHQVQAGMEERPGQLRKSMMVQEFDLLTLFNSAGSRGWTTATPHYLLDFLSCRDIQGNGTKMAREASCPGLGRVGVDAYRDEHLWAKQYAAKFLRHFSNLKLAMNKH